MRALIKIAMIMMLIAPAPAFASVKNKQLECVFSFGLAKKSCKEGFHGSTYGELSKTSTKMFKSGFIPSIGKPNTKSNPNKSKETKRLECIFSFGLAERSCKDAFHGASYKELIGITNKMFRDGIAPPTGTFQNKDIQNLMITILPDSIRIGFDISGNGISVGWSVEKKVKKIVRMLNRNGGKFDKEMMYEVTPDILRINVGASFAFILTVRVGSLIFYDTQESIVKVLGILKNHNKKKR